MASEADEYVRADLVVTAEQVRTIVREELERVLMHDEPWADLP